MLSWVNREPATMGRMPLEDDTPLQVLVESLVQPVAEEPAALGDPHPHRHLDVAGEGVHGSCLVLRLVAEEGDHVPRPGESRSP